MLRWTRRLQRRLPQRPENNMVPLICIRAKNHSRIASKAVGWASEECRTQVSIVLSAVPDGAEVLLAYEQVWTTRTFMPVNTDHVLHVTKEIQEMILGRKGVTSILYGGSANPGTFEKIAEGFDGLFLGCFRMTLTIFFRLSKRLIVHEMHSLKYLCTIHLLPSIATDQSCI